MSVQLLSSRCVSRAVSRLFNALDSVHGSSSGSRWPCGQEIYSSAAASGLFVARFGGAQYSTSQDRRGSRGGKNLAHSRQNQYPSSDVFDGREGVDKQETGPSIVLDKGPFSMLKEDVLDICARYDIFLSPDQVSPVYRRDHNAVLARTGWRLMLPTQDLRARAKRLIDAKVGPHKVNLRVAHDDNGPNSSRLVRLAEQSKGRYLLVTNLPGGCTRSNIQQLFKGFKMSDYSLNENTLTIELFDYSSTRHGRDQLRDDQGRGRRRPGGEDPWGRGSPERDPNHHRAACVKFATIEDAFLAWRSRHNRQHVFSPDMAPKMLKCRILE